MASRQFRQENHDRRYLIMTGGRNLEHAGVHPDRVLNPSASAIAAGRDPVSTLGAEELWVKLDSGGGGETVSIREGAGPVRLE